MNKKELLRRTKLIKKQSTVNCSAFNDVQRIKTSFYGKLYNEAKKRNIVYVMKSLRMPEKIFKAHIEEQFEDGMNWENRRYWQLDHIVPVNDFCLDNPEEFVNAYTYKNLKPVWKAYV